MTQGEKFEEWSIVELFGHQRIAGKVSSQSIGGCGFIRVDVPENEKRPAFTKLYGAQAIYAISIVDEATARVAAANCMAEPMNPWSIRHYIEEKMLPEYEEDEEEDQ